MSEFAAMDDAPTDGTWIEGVNSDGEVARIQSRQIHPKVPDILGWFVGEPEKQGDWTKSTCFYPVGWRRLA